MTEISSNNQQMAWFLCLHIKGAIYVHEFGQIFFFCLYYLQCFKECIYNDHMKFESQS